MHYSCRTLIPALIAILSCGESQDPAGQTAGSGATPAVLDAPTGEAAELPSLVGSEAEGDGYRLEAVADEVALGASGTLRIHIAGRTPWHVNEEYPTNVVVGAHRGLQVDQTEFEKADATEYGAERVLFSVPFSGAAVGEHRVEMTVDFAVCTDEACVPEERRLMLPVSVTAAETGES